MALKGDRVGRGNSIYDNVAGGEMWFINDENPEATKETYVCILSFIRFCGRCRSYF